jgi:hypothetical protein
MKNQEQTRNKQMKQRRLEKIVGHGSSNSLAKLIATSKQRSQPSSPPPQQQQARSVNNNGQSTWAIEGING